ncbi:hypothetical protein MASR1M36_13870 [Candidatus Cloacimonadaceae bacterium]
MKVTFGNGVSTYSGKYDQVVYLSLYNGLLCLGRRFRLPTETEQNIEIGEIGTNLDNLYKEADPLYISDLKSYAAKNSKEHAPKYVERAHPMPSSKALFIHCMYMWQKTDPTHIDLKTITLSDMMTLESLHIIVISGIFMQSRLL